MGSHGVRAGMGLTPASEESREERKEERKEKNGDYRQFDDVPVSGEEGGWRYDPRGEERGEAQKEFFDNNSNYNSIIENMSSIEKHVFSSYWASGYFMRGQQYKGWDNMTDRERAMTQVYDKILDQSVIDRGIVVTRLATAELVLGAGNTKGSLSSLQNAEGQTVISRGNMSTAVAKEGLRISPTYDSSKNVEYRIHIPAGMKGAGMWIGDRRINHWGRIQREFMTNRDARFKVGKTTTRKDSQGHTIYVVNLTYAGHLEHDYGKRGKMSKRDLDMIL